MSRSQSARGVLFALSAATAWGVSAAIAGGVFDVIPPAYVAQSRAAIAAVVLVPLAARRGFLRPQKGMWRLGVLAVNLALVNVTFYIAMDRLGVGPGATIQFLGPILVLVWVVLVRGQSVRPLIWAAAVGAVVGVGFVTEAWSLTGGDMTGVLSGLAAAVTFAFYLLYGEHLAEDFEPMYITTWGFILTSLIWMVVLPVWTFPTEGLASGDWIDLLIIGTIGTAMPFVLEFRALSLVSSSIVGVVATIEPAIGALAALVLLDQTMSPIQWVGVALVVVAVATVQRWGLDDDQPAVLPVA